MSENKERPVLWRHHLAGVLLGWISESNVPGHVRFNGVRIWSWRGGRTDCASLAVQGPREGDRITPCVLRDVALKGSVEIYDVDAKHIARGIELAEPSQ